MSDPKQTPREVKCPIPAEQHPVYEPPRITKKRSVSRATLFTGGGPDGGGLIGGG